MQEKDGAQLRVNCEPCMHEEQTGERALLFVEAHSSNAISISTSIMLQYIQNKVAAV